MPVTYFDSKGNPVENVPTKEEIEAFNASMEEKEAKILEAEQELNKYKTKEFNFSKFRDANNADKEKMLEKYTAKEKLVIEELSDVKKELNEFRDRNFSSVKDRVLSDMVGNDKEARKQIEDAAKSFAGEPKTEAEIAQRYANAYTLVNGRKPDINPLNSYTPSGSHDEIWAGSQKKKFTETDRGSEFFAQNFPGLVDKKK